MSKKRKKHGYAERLKYMHMLENGYTIGYCRLLKFPDTSAEKIRITIGSTRKDAQISEVALFYAPEIE